MPTYDERLDYQAVEMRGSWWLVGACTGCGAPQVFDCAGTAFVCDGCIESGRSCGRCGQKAHDDQCTDMALVVCADCWRPLAGTDPKDVMIDKMGYTHAYRTGCNEPALSEGLAVARGVPLVGRKVGDRVGLAAARVRGTALTSVAGRERIELLGTATELELAAGVWSPTYKP